MPVRPLPLRVLLIEDNPGDALLIRRALDEGDTRCMVTHAETLAQGVEMLNGLTKDVILADLNLPDSRGLETVTSILAAAPHTPVIVLTGLSDSGIAIQALTCGAQDFLVKGQADALLLARSIRYAMLRKRESDELHASEERYRTLVELSPDAIFVHDGRHILFANRATSELLRAKSFETLVGSDVPTILPTANSDPRLVPGASVNSSISPFIEERLVRQDGSTIDIEVAETPFPYNGSNATRVIARDITVRRTADNQTRAALVQTETLLKEAYHRIKNNLQVISSLLSLQSTYASDAHDVELFRESQNRIKSIGLIHEKLYQSADLKRIDFSEYVRQLLEDLVRSYGEISERIALHIDVEPAQFDMTIAVPCGLIINELVSNALKHAFPKERRGEIHVAMHTDAQGKCELSVNDTGTGIPDSVDVRSARSMGMQLVNTLTDQLQGTLALNRTAGTNLTISFYPASANFDTSARA